MHISFNYKREKMQKRSRKPVCHYGKKVIQHESPNNSLYFFFSFILQLQQALYNVVSPPQVPDTGPSILKHSAAPLDSLLTPHPPTHFSIQTLNEKHVVEGRDPCFIFATEALHQFLWSTEER